MIILNEDIVTFYREAFMPYLERCFEEIFKLINYPQEDIRKASIEALLQFCINFSKINTDEGRKALLKALCMFIPKLSELIRLDEERTVAICGLEAYLKLLREIKSDVIFGGGHKEAIINCVIDVLTGTYDLYLCIQCFDKLMHIIFNHNLLQAGQHVKTKRKSRVLKQNKMNY